MKLMIFIIAVICLFLSNPLFADETINSDEAYNLRNQVDHVSIDMNGQQISLKSKNETSRVIIAQYLKLGQSISFYSILAAETLLEFSKKNLNGIYQLSEKQKIICTRHQDADSMDYLNTPVGLFYFEKNDEKSFLETLKKLNQLQICLNVK